MKIRRKTAADGVAGPKSRAIEPLIRNKSIGYGEPASENLMQILKLHVYNEFHMPKVIQKSSGATSPEAPRDPDRHVSKV